jgi:hypothetical protein
VITCDRCGSKEIVFTYSLILERYWTDKTVRKELQIGNKNNPATVELCHPCANVIVGILSGQFQNLMAKT